MKRFEVFYDRFLAFLLNRELLDWTTQTLVDRCANGNSARFRGSIHCESGAIASPLSLAGLMDVQAQLETLQDTTTRRGLTLGDLGDAEIHLDRVKPDGAACQAILRALLLPLSIVGEGMAALTREKEQVRVSEIVAALTPNSPVHSSHWVGSDCQNEVVTLQILSEIIKVHTPASESGWQAECCAEFLRVLLVGENEEWPKEALELLVGFFVFRA